MFTPSQITKSSPEIEELKKAAVRGDVEFLTKSVALNKHRDYYLTVFPKIKPKDHHYGNIFHIAVLENRVEFIREGIEILPIEVVQQLLLQQCEEAFMFNPLHVAASIGNLAIVKMFLDVMKCSPSTYRRKPWLEKSSTGQSPCHVALVFGYVDCGLEILKMDMEMLCNMSDNRDFSLLYTAVSSGSNRFSLEILNSAYSFSCSGPDGSTPLYGVTSCSEGEKICRRLLEREPELIKQIHKFGGSVLHTWAKSGKLWPFECVQKSNDIIPDITRVLVDLMSVTDDKFGFNPLHILATFTASEEDATKIAQLLIDNYKQEVMVQASSIITDDHVFPWLVQSKKGETPLSLAIERHYECFAMYILSVDDDVLMKCEQNVLFLAINKGCHKVARRILDIVDNKGWTQLLTNDQQLNVLHLAPLCTLSMGERLLKQHPELLEGVDEKGTTILHSWIKHSQIGLFKHLIHSGEVDQKWRSYFVKLISATNYKDGNNPLHVVADSTHDEAASVHVTTLLVKAYKEETCNWVRFSPASLPWFAKNKDGEGPLHLAIYNKREKLALYMLSLYEGDHINELLDFYKSEHNNTLFLAIEYNCFQVAKEILTRLDKESRMEYLVDADDGRNILHLATSFTDRDFGVWLINEVPEYIVKADYDGYSPMAEASDHGDAWIIQAMLMKNPFVLNLAPFAWIKACEKGHVSTIRAFIDYPLGNFRDLCIKHKDSPLHHIKLPNLREYDEFLKIPRVKDLINIQDSRGATPLHKAIRNRNIMLTEALLEMDKLVYNIKDNENETPIELLEQVCDEDYQWYEMCKRAGFYSRIKMPSFERKTELLETRDGLLVAAALVASITFFAGFNLPGSFNQDTGEAILVKKAIFFVFLVSDTLALSCSILVLISLVWSMIYDSSRSLLLIDRSMVLFLVSLYSTLLAFMTGVYVVTSPNSVWASIVIVVLCCLTGISANGTILCKVLDKLIPSANKEQKPKSFD